MQSVHVNLKNTAYKHVESKNQADILKLSNEVKSKIKEIMSKISQLELYSVNKSAISKAVTKNSFKCSQFSEVFQSKVSLRHHTEKQHENYKCELCQYKANLSTIFKSHSTKKHNPEVTRLNNTHEVLRNEEEYKALEISFDEETREGDLFLDCKQASTVPATNSATVTPPPLEFPPSHTKEGQWAFLGCSITPKNFFKKTKLDLSHLN